MKKKINKFIYWTPRILCILFLLFLTIFSLDVFDPENNYTLGQTLLALFMHNIPVFVLAIILWISWKYEIVGGIVFILAGILFMISSVARQAPDPWYIALAVSLIIAVPAFMIGILFLMGWFKKRKMK